jgi:hypothetical protein
MDKFLLISHFYSSLHVSCPTQGQPIEASGTHSDICLTNWIEERVSSKCIPLNVFISIAWTSFCSSSPKSRVEPTWGSNYVDVATPLWPSVGVKPDTFKVGDLKSFGTPECLEFDNKAQNTSHWGVLVVIGKVLKRRYRKWPRIGHSDIYSPSYGQKKSRESNWQFDSRPLKVGNRPLPDLRIESAIRRCKDLDEGYKFGSDLVAIILRSRELWAPKVPGLHPRQFRDNFGIPTWESREKEPLRCSLGGEVQRIL